MSDDVKPQPEPETYAIVELLGHRKYAGRLLEVERFGGKLGRLEVPQADGTTHTVFFGAASVYALSVVTEDVARHVALSGACAVPVSAWDFPKALPAAGPVADPADHDDVCETCGTVPANRACDHGRCSKCCDERCDTHCERALGLTDPDDLP